MHDPARIAPGRARAAVLAAGLLLATLASGCAAPPAPPPPAPEWGWPEGQGAPRDLEADRRRCEYDAAPWRTTHPDFHRIEITRCLEAYGWRRVPRAGTPGG